MVLIPLAAMIFHSLGRHPLAGLAAAFAGVSGGYSANLLLGTIDPLLSGITQSAAQIIDPAYSVGPEVNWYFMFISTFVIAGLGTWITNSIVEPSWAAIRIAKVMRCAATWASCRRRASGTQRCGLGGAGGVTAAGADGHSRPRRITESQNRHAGGFTVPERHRGIYLCVLRHSRFCLWPPDGHHAQRSRCHSRHVHQHEQHGNVHRAGVFAAQFVAFSTGATSARWWQ